MAMRLRHIEVFHAVYNRGSITAAAQFLNVSQPSVSKVLAHAEQQLGYALFDRVRGKLIPTREANRLIGRVSGVYQEIDELRQLAANLGAAEVGRIRLAVTPAFGIELAPAAVAAFAGMNPGARFSVETLHYHQVLRALGQSRVDLGLVFHPSPEAGIEVHTLAEARFLAVAPPFEFGAGTGPVAIEELAGRSLISLSNRGPLGRLLAERVEACGARFDSTIRVETYQMAMAMVAYGGGVTIIDEITARSARYENVTIHPLKPEMTFNIGLVYREDQPLTLLARKFVAELEVCVRTFLEGGEAFASTHEDGA